MLSHAGCSVQAVPVQGQGRAANKNHHDGAARSPKRHGGYGQENLLLATGSSLCKHDLAHKSCSQMRRESSFCHPRALSALAEPRDEPVPEPAPRAPLSFPEVNLSLGMGQHMGLKPK